MFLEILIIYFLKNLFIIFNAVRFEVRNVKVSGLIKCHPYTFKSE